MRNIMPQDKLKVELVTKLKKLVDNAKSLSPEERYKSGGYKNNPDLKYPQTKSEYIVVEALNLLLDVDWVDDDPLLDEITSIIGQLDTDVNQPLVWEDLFRLMRELDGRK
ncbi:MAG TPA: hypothetical protein VJ841_00640 [Candidatus Saccharimonadales bacterium]|nr:hypothetical protein [Candidatus Saccharimonadales bacterium]